MSYSRKPGPLDEAPDLETTSPMAPITTVGDSGPVGAKGGGGACGGAPRLRGWPRAVSWRGDFPDEREERPSDEDEDAQIHAEAILDDETTACRTDGLLRLGRFTVRLRVSADQTWVVRSAKTDALLAHEQGHFDICGIDARQVMQDLVALRAQDGDELGGMVQDRLQRSRIDAQAMSDRYDEETDHGRTADAQRRWETAIREAIEGGHALRPPT